MYFLINLAGECVGPYDIESLRGQVNDGTIVPESVLVDSETGVSIRARDLPQLFSLEAYTPYKSPIQAGGLEEGESDAMRLERGHKSKDFGPTPKSAVLGWICVAAGLCSTIFTPYIFILFSMIGIYTGWKAKEGGHKPSELLVAAAAGSVPIGLILAFLFRYLQIS